MEPTIMYSVKGLKQTLEWNELNDYLKLNQDENRASLKTRYIYFSAV